MRKTYLLLMAVFSMVAANAQSTANYVFATNTTGSLTSMSSGTTQLVNPNIDDNPSLLTNIGFDFFFQGVRYSQFSVNSNGVIRLGAVAQAAAPYHPLAQGGIPIISAYGADQRTHAGDGKVHYKVTGVAPNKILIVEWLNMQANFNTGGTADLTYQVRLFESTGVIEFVYGSMTMSALGAASTDSRDPHIGFSSNNVANTVGSVTAPQSGTPAPTYSGTGILPVANLYTAGAITTLTSAVNGARRVFTFTPPVPTAPTALNFTAVTQVAMTLNWTDSPNERNYAIYRSTDGINYSFDGTAPLNAISYAASGLTAGTNYFWRVFAVSEGGLSTALAGTQATNPPVNITSNGTGGGLWSAPATWLGGVVPGATDNVTILNGDIVTIETAGAANTLTVGQGVSGILQFEQTTARILTITNVVVSAGGIFRSNAAGTVTTHLLVVNGNLTNNGTIDFSTNANTAGAGITFAGASDATATFAASSTTDFTQTGGLSIFKGTNNTPVLSFVPGGTTTVLGANAVGFLTVLNGTFKLTGTNTFSNPVFSTAGYTIPATGGFWMDNANATVAGLNGSPTVSGLLRISQGTFNIGTSSGNSMGFAAGCTINVEGGAVNATGRFGVDVAGNIFTYNQSGGTVTVCTIGNGSGTLASFDLGTSGLTIVSITNGTIICQLAATGLIDYRMQSAGGVASLPGGTLQLGNALSGAAKNFIARGVLPFNTIITNTSANHTLSFPTTTPVTYNYLAQNLTINTGTTFTHSFGGIALYSGNVVNNGTFTATVALSRVYNFSNGVATTWSGTGTFTSPMVSFEIDNLSGVTLNPVNQIPTNRVIMFNGSFTNCNKITLGSGGTSTGIVQIGNTSAGLPTAAGTFDVPFTFNLGTGGQVISYLRVTTSRTMGPEINPTRILTTLSVDDNDLSHVLTLAGGNLAVSSGTTPTINLTNGKINLAGSTLTLGLDAITAGTLTSPAGWVYNGLFKRWISATAGNRDFPVGVAAFKRNASINYTGAPTGGGSLTAQWVSSPGGTNGLPLTEGAINVTQTTNAGYWTITAGDALGGGTYTGTFTGSGIGGVTDVTQLVLLKRVNAVSPWVLNGTHVTGAGTPANPVVSRTAMSGFSDFTIGSSNLNTLPVDLLTFSGYKENTHNVLKWRTVTEVNNVGFEVQRSTDGMDYLPIGFVNSLAAGGTSTGPLNYSYIDNSPAGSKQYYRLRQVDINGVARISNIVLIKGAKPVTLSIEGLFPNPASTQLSVLLDAPAADKITMLVMDVSGKAILTKTTMVETGSNTISLDLSRLSAGQYMIKLVCSSYCESPAAKFVKQ